MVKLPDIAVMLIATNGNMHIADLNPEACRQLGYDREELVGQHNALLMTPASRQRVLERVQFGRSRSGMERLPVEVFCKNGEIKSVEISSHRFTGDEGNQLWALATIEDVSVRSQAENQYLETASKLDQANRSLQQFSQITAAQLGQPLAMLESFVTMIDSQVRAALPGQADALDLLQLQLLQISKTLESVSHLQRSRSVDAGIREVDMALLLKLCLAPLQAKIKARGATLIIEGEWPVVSVASDELGRVIQGLIDNALSHAVSERLLAIHLSGGIWQNHVRVIITDNGEGFELAKVQAALAGEGDEPASDVAPRRRRPGAELPASEPMKLAECRRIVEQIGGHIQVQQMPGEYGEIVLMFPDQSRPA